jgi:hypothetical protein
MGWVDRWAKGEENSVPGWERGVPMPAIVIVLLFLVLFLLAFLAVLIGPFLGLGFAVWKHGKHDVALGSAAASREQSPKSDE